MNTPRLGIPMLAAAQAQKHVTHNQALQKLDALVQLSVLSRTTTAPPSSLNEGDAYIVATGATGDWVGHDNEIAVVDGGQWSFVVPGPGWIAYVTDEDLPYRFLAAWAQLPLPGSVDQLGVNASADNTNRLAVSSPATLLNHAGGGHQVKVNKASTAETASLLYQNNWSGRAEMGIAGSDDFQVKVSPDGANWKTGLSVSPESGLVTVPHGMNSGTISGVGDNSAISIPIPASAMACGLIFVFSEDDDYPQPGVFAAMWFDVGLSLTSVAMSLGSKAEITTGPLTGTTGSDGRMTVSADLRQIHVENRLGSHRRFRWFLIN